MSKPVLQATIWFVLVLCIIPDVIVGMPVLLGMDVHLGSAASINPRVLASFWGWAGIGVWLLFQAVLVGMLIRVRKS